MPTLKGNYVSNMNAFRSGVIGIYTIGETLTKNFDVITELRMNKHTDELMIKHTNTRMTKNIMPLSINAGVIMKSHECESGIEK